MYLTHELLMEFVTICVIEFMREIYDIYVIEFVREISHSRRIYMYTCICMSIDT